MRKAILILAAATCLAGANTAFAQDAEKTPAQAFAGPRAEVTVGLDQSGDDAIYGKELTGMRAGGAVGYDVAIGKRVTLGVEAGIGWMIAGHTNFGPYLPADPNTYKLSARSDVDVSGRVGYALSSKTLIFAKAGWEHETYGVQSATGVKFDDRKNEGVRLGAGIEQKLTRNVYAKAEYRYTMGSVSGDNDPKRHQLLTGIGVRF
jgi:outer membrane immunogenic protein